MKATLEFNLPEDQNDYDLYKDAFEFFKVIWELNQELRKKIKYEELSEEEYNVYEKINEFVAELINEYGIGKHF
jgi:acyl carrier protein